MAKLDTIIPKSAIESITTADTSITKLDATTLAFVKTITKLSEELKKGNISFKEINASQKASAKTKTQLTEIQKQQIEAEKSLERQRKQGLKASQKLIDKELAMDAAIKKTVKSEADLIAKTNALVAKRKQLDQTTESGRKKHAALTAEIKKNTDALKGQDKQIGRNQRHVGDYGKALEKIKGSFVLMAAGVAIAVAAFKKFAGKIQESIDLYDVQVLAETALSTALGFTSKKILDQASAFQTLTRFGDEQIIGGQAFLAQMGMTEEQILRITPAILDFAQAKGIDLRTASDLVSKSIGSETNALSRYGIQIEGAVGSSERLESALAALNEKYKGQAEAALIGKGAIIQLQNTFGDLMERIGRVITKGINPFIQGINKLLTVRDKESESLKKQQTDLNILIGTITNVNTSEKIRVDLIEDLEKLYPNFLKNLNAETVSNEQLTSRLLDVNEQYKNKIAQVILDEELSGVHEKLAENYADEYDNLKRIESAKIRDNAYTKQNISALTDNIRLIKERRSELEAERQEIIKSVEAWIAGNKAKDDFFTTPPPPDGEGGTTTDRKKIVLDTKQSVEEEQQIIGDGIDYEFRAREEADRARIEAEKALHEKLDEMGEEQLAKDLERIDKELEAENLAAEKKKELEAERIEVVTASIQAISAIGNAYFELERQRFSQQSADLARQKAYELEMAETSGASKDAINEKFAKKEAELKTKQAQADKRSAIFSAIINIATGITAMFQAGPAGIILAALTAAMGAISLATIISQPIPQFFKGTENAPDGVLIAGDRGREIINPKSGSPFIVDKPTMLTGLAGATIYSNQDTEKMLSGSNVGFDSPDLRTTLEINNRELIKAIQNKTEYTFNFHKGTIGQRKGNYYKQYKNMYAG